MVNVGAEEPNEAFGHVVAELGGIPWMAPFQGRRMWEHFEVGRPTVALDIGTYLGASAAFMATGMRALGIPGRVVTIDSGQNVTPETTRRWEDLWERCGVANMIEYVLIDDSNYAWWLGRQLESSIRVLGEGQHGQFDFVYLDGAKVLGIDAAATLFILELLRPGGWLVLDDLDWSYHEVSSIVSAPVTSYAAGGVFRFSDDELRASHVRLVLDLVLRRSPLVGQTLEDHNCNWVWAQRKLVNRR